MPACNVREVRDLCALPGWGEPHWIVKTGINRALDSVPTLFRGRLLDVGCGSSPYIVVDPAVKQWWGCDLQPSRLGRGPDVLADGQCLPFADEVFDTLLCTEVLEHVPRPAAMIAEMSRVLRPGGHLVLSVPFLFGLHEEPRDYYRLTHHALRHLADESRLRVIVCEPTGGFFAVLAQLISYHIPEFGSPVGRLAGRLVRASIQKPLWWLDARMPRTRDPLGYLLVGERMP